MFNVWLPFEWIVALRFLREGRLQTMFIITGIAIGVGVIVFMSALLAGLQGNFITRVLSAQAHIQLLSPQEITRPLQEDIANRLNLPWIQPPLQRMKLIDQWPSVVSLIQSIPEVKAVTPVASGSALVLRGSASRAVSVVGIEPEMYYRIVDLNTKMVRGTSQINASDMLLGVDLATELGVDVGDKLRLNTANGASITLKIVGIFDLGNKSANQRTTYVGLRIAQNLLSMAGGVNGIEVAVFDVYAAERVAQRITVATGVQADSWIKSSAQFFVAISAQTTANTVIRFFVGLSVAFGIASVLVVSVVQKSREIGIMRAMGISRGQILRIFLLQGGLLALSGALVGSGLGAAGLVLWQRLAKNADGTPLFGLVLDPELFVIALVMATVTGLVAAFAPALRAARLDPVVAIRA